jgi:hypothetical protein
MFSGQERNHAFSGCVVPEVGDQMTQVVFLTLTDGTIGQKHAIVMGSQTTHGMIRIDPSFNASNRIEFGTRRPELGSCSGYGTV